VFVGLHDSLAVHALHVPLLQTMSVPHDVPFGAGLPVSLQVGSAPVQSKLPTLHGFAVGTQAAPFLHAVHVPDWQTCPVPHDVPFGKFDPVSWQVDSPVEQSVSPAWQLLVGAQAFPFTHSAHVPP
jgi:hypothetical protein